MDLKALHSLMKRKGFHHFSGMTNNRDEILYMEFSELHNGRGKSIEFVMGDDGNDVLIYTREEQGSHNRLSDNEAFRLIEDKFKDKKEN